MTNKEFKAQFSPTFSEQMKQIGFTGSGWHYAMETKTFVFVFTLEVNKHKQVDLFFGIQPKAVTQMGDYMTHNFKKIAPQSCELTIQLIRSLKKPFWNVGADKKENEKEAHDVFAFIHKNVLPIITKYVTNPDLLDKIEPSDLSDKNIMHRKLYGMHPAGMPSRTAWMLAIYHEDKTPPLPKHLHVTGWKIWVRLRWKSHRTYKKCWMRVWYLGMFLEATRMKILFLAFPT